MKKILSNNNQLQIRYTPWDEYAFGFKTAEIISFQVSDDEESGSLINSLDEWASKESIRFIYTRVGAHGKAWRSIDRAAGRYR